MADPQEQRQLLAIMFTDVVGYTALTERDEAAAVRVREQHRDLIKTLVTQFDGELVDVTGDESLSIFPSALRAVDCALALQGALRNYRDLRVRVGIHLGDVLRRNGEVIGEGVNVAARIRPLAEPGGICVSEPVHQIVRSRVHVTMQALGAKTFKNVGQPMPVYSLAAVESATRSAHPRRRFRIALGVLSAAAALAIAALLTNGPAVMAWLALNLPRLLSSPVEQQIGFAETSDGVRIAYATTGAGPPIVSVLGWMTHLKEGLGSPLYDQSGAIAAGSRDALLVRYDGRGFGLSDRDVEDFSLDARVRDLEAVVDTLGLQRFGLYAISAGGPTAIAYADRHPEKVSRILLAATFPGGAAGNISTTGLSAEARRARRELMRTAWQSPATRAMTVQLLAPDAGDVERRVLMHFLQVAGDGPALAGFADASGSIDVTDEARRIRVPTLVVSGGADPLLPGGRLLASLIPNARFEILEGANHIEASVTDPRLATLRAEFFGQDAE
jgi:class 3 adenylate cyclase/pimeloyl-ACP methyl ester carboxylesterase